jgi:STE24 endopeptidase
MMTSVFVILCGALIVAKWGAQIGLEWLNQRHVLAHANAVPPAFANTVTPEIYAKSAAYTLAKSRFHIIELTWNAVVLAVALFRGVLPCFFGF